MPNRLAREASPYLKQHAENPVDWYPWGREALERAKLEGKPILLSIGYSACHWCHVMERECFEDAAIAKLMNEHFVSIKVDREERPDLDQIYQLTAQLLGKSGGWPLTVFLTPEQRPFFAGTYFPPVDRHGLPSFPRILGAVADAYVNQRADIDLQAKEITQAIAQVSAPTEKEEGIPPDVLARAATKLQTRFDDEHGGFGSRPKFPSTMSLDVLLMHAIANQDEKARARVKRALDGMRDGGIWDQLGGGFHRYSTDERWLVPHFEKMLYDNALLLRLYVDGYRVWRNPRYANTAREIVAYLEREMLDASGGFYATQDADSEGEEGKFFVWTQAEIRRVLGEDADLACARFGVGPEGNFEEPSARSAGADTDASVLSIARSIEELAVKFTMAPSEIERRLERARAALFAAREKRVKPFRDEKILASWNGLLVSSLADASRALHEPRWLELAERAFAFVWTHLRKGDRVVRHASQSDGFLDDQAFVACAALDLHEATANPDYLERARSIAKAIREAFVDESGTFYLAPIDGEALIARTQDVHDHAVPSATSKALELFARLGEEVHAKSLNALVSAALDNPFGMSSLVLVADRVVNESTEITFTDADPKSELAKAAWTPIVRNRTIRWTTTGDKVGPNVVVCRDRSCSLPASTYRELLSLLSLEGDAASNV